MALSEKLELILSADPSRAVSEMQRFAKESDKSLTSVETRFKSFGQNALKIGTAGIGVGGLLTQMASGDIEAANQLKAAIGQVGQSYDEFADQIDKAAEAQVRYGNTDEEVNGAITTLTLAFGDTQKALDQLQVTTDLAARKHISLADAASIVAKAHGGSARVFKEFGIQVQENADGTKDYDGALGQLADKLKGQASAAADTFGGRLDALKAKAENIVSEFGQKWGPAILGISTGLTALGGISTGVAAIQGRLALAHEAAAAAALEQAGAESTLAGAEGLAATGAAGLTASLGPLAIAAAAALAYQARPGKDGLLDYVLQSTEGFGNLSGQVQAFAGDTDDLSAATEVVIGKAETAEETFKRWHDAVKATDDAHKDLADTLSGETDPMFAIIDAADRQADSQRNVEEKTAALTWAIAEHGRNSSEAAKAQDELNQANIDAVKSAGDLTQAQLDLEESVRKGETSVDNARWTLQTWVNQGLITQDQADSIIGRFSDLKDKADALNGTTISIALAFDAQQAEDTLRKLLADTGNYAAQAREYVNSPGQSVSGSSPSPGGGGVSRPRAMGGPVSFGSSYLVGEHGIPEIFTAGANGYITPLEGMGGSIKQTFVMPPNADIAEQASRGARRALILSRR